MTYEEWERSVPNEIRSDVLWKVTSYRRALFLGELCWSDATKLAADQRTISTADQLFRAAGSISAQIAEGYSRSTGNDRARFYEYAAGSARESRDWYYKSRRILGSKVCEHRLALTTEIVKLTVTMIAQQRRAGRGRVQ